MTIQSISFLDQKTGRLVRANIKSARMVKGVLELNFGMAYDIDGEAVLTPPALESALGEPKVAESH